MLQMVLFAVSVGCDADSEGWEFCTKAVKLVNLIFKVAALPQKANEVNQNTLHAQPLAKQICSTSTSSTCDVRAVRFLYTGWMFRSWLRSVAGL